MTLTTFTPEEAFAAGETQVGGKAFGLARLHRYGLPVPAMLTLGAGLYHHVMQDAAIAEALAAVIRTKGEGSNSLARLREALRVYLFSDEEKAALQAALHSAGLAGQPLAVRSSAIGEDGAEASFAGIHESVLHVDGPDALHAAILEVFASLWTETAVRYRLAKGFALDGVPMAVVVCAMTPIPKASGVAFTADPLTGRRDRYVIEATAGYGDALVRGQVQGHRYEIPFDETNQLQPPQEGDSLLTAGDLATVSQALTLAHDCLCDGDEALDFEWVYDGAAVTFVQVRPVTALPTPGLPSLPGQNIIWSNANFKEVLLPIPSPMGWAMAKGSIPLLITTLPKKAGYTLPKGPPLIRRLKGRPYLNIANQQWLWFDGFGAPPANINRSLGGHQPEIRLPDGPTRLPVKLKRLWRMTRLGAFLTKKGKSLAARADALIAEARAFRRRDLDSLSDEALKELTFEQYQRFAGFFDDFSASSGICGGTLTMFQNALDNLSTEDDRAILQGLLSGGKVDSAEHGRRLRELAALARDCKTAQAILAAGTLPTPLGRSAFEVALAAYLDEFGHRGLGETDISKPRWIEEPGYLLDQIRLMVDREDRDLPGNWARQAAEEALARLPRRQGKRLAAAAEKARNGMALREKAKSALIAGVEPARRILLETGQRLHSRGVLDSRDDIFWLTFNELTALQEGRWSDTAPGYLIADRKARYTAWAEETAPDVFEESTSGTVITAQPGPAIRKNGKNGQWQGMGAYPGRYTGVARILTRPEDSHRLQPGDILVAPTTDPAWTPIFLQAGALIMETGGAVSHGVIVAREYGLPTVVNIPGIVTALKDGETVTIDGAAGTISRNT